MAAGLPLVSVRRRVPALLAGTALAAASGASAETALLTVSVIVEPRCAVSAPARIGAAGAAAATAEAAGMVEVACTKGTSWSVEAERGSQLSFDPDPGLAPGARQPAVGQAASPAAAPARSAADRPNPADVVRITVRY